MGTQTVVQPPAHEKRGYKVLGLVSSAHAVTHMYSALMPIVYPQVMEQFGFGYAQLGFMVGVGNTLMSLLQGTYAFLMRRVMRKVLLALSNILLALSLGVMSLTGSFAGFFLLNVLARVSMSPQHPVGNSLVAENFGRKLRGTAFAVNFAGGNAGTLLVPALGTLGVATIGWRYTLAILAVLALGTGLLSLTLPEKRNPAPASDSKGGKLLAAGRDWVSPLRERNIRLVVLAAAVAAGGRGIGVVMVYVPLYFHQGLGLNSVNYATLFTIMMAGSVAGPILVGRISDSVGRKRMATTTYALSALAAGAILLAGNSMLYLVPATVFLGLVVYSQSSQIQALLADVSSSEKRDMAYSVFFTVSYLAGGVWSVALGLMVDKAGFTGAFLLMALSYLAGMLVLIPVKAVN